MQKQMQKQAIEQTSDGSAARARWFQVGVVSATVLTPLVRRWQTLRAAEQARALWEAGRAGAARPFLRARRGEAAPRDVNPRLWLAGAGVGLVAAGALAYYVVARRRSVADDEVAVELRLDAPAGPVRHLTDQVVHMRGRVRRPSAPATPAPAASAPPAPTSPAATPPASAPSAAPAPSGADALVDEAPAADPTSAADLPIGPIVGNNRTLVYHLADAAHLPAPEHRTYFRSAAEAEAAGFRADRGEPAEGQRG